MLCFCLCILISIDIKIETNGIRIGEDLIVRYFGPKINLTKMRMQRPNFKHVSICPKDLALTGIG